MRSTTTTTTNNNSIMVIGIDSDRQITSPMYYHTDTALRQNCRNGADITEQQMHVGRAV